MNIKKKIFTSNLMYIFTPILYLFRIFKIDNKKILFENFTFRGYGDNPKYIAENLISKNKDYKLIWVVKNMAEEMPKGIRKVKIYSIKYFYHLATSKIWIANSRLDKYIRKRKGQFYIQTWHGGLGLKKIESASKDITADYIKTMKNDSKMIDILISNSKYRTEQYINYFFYKGKILEIGSPRNDIFFRDNKDLILKIKDELDIKENKKVILYAPTFRKYDYKYITFDINELLEKGYEVLIRLHPGYVLQESISDKVKDVTKYPDVNELLIISDIVISDYSSVFFDFLYTGGQVYLYAPDYKEYLNNRGLNFKYEDLPFSKSYNGEELINNILNNDSKNYENKLEKFLSQMDIKDDGQATEKIVRIIDRVIKGEKIDYEKI